MARSLDPKKIKSAQRALEVLEYFQNGRTEATVMDIARSMGYPQSSTSELLSCLVALGYLTRDRAARTYRPTARVAVLGAWVQPNLFREGRLLPTMDELAQEAGAAVVLGNRVGLDIQYIHAVTPVGVEVRVREGVSASLAHSAMGKAVLASMDRNYMRKLMHRLNAESAPELRVPFEAVVQECDATYAQGFALADEHGGRMISMLLSQNGPEDGLALGMLLTHEQYETRREYFVQLLRGAVARLAPKAATQRYSAPPRSAERAPMQMMG
ncbi:MAG: IclR family transcriptional regulator [Hyphomonadaceae bacterium]